MERLLRQTAKGDDGGADKAAPTATLPRPGLNCRAISRTDQHPRSFACAILLHGWGSSSRFWTRFAPLLDADFIISPDLRGFGASQGEGELADFAQHVADVRLLVDRIAGRGGLVIIGHSYGGLIAQEVAVTRPSGVAAMVLLSTQSRAETFTLTEATRALIGSIRDAASRAAALRRLIPRYYRPGSLSDAEIAALVEDGCRASPDALRSSLLSAAAAQPLGAQALRAADMPVLALGGEFDILPEGAAARVAAAFPGGTAAAVAGAAHCAAYDQPERLAALINPFLSRARASQ